MAKRLGVALFTLVLLVAGAGIAQGAGVKVKGNLLLTMDGVSGVPGIIFSSGEIQRDACYGTVTSIEAGAGLVSAQLNPITTSGSLSVNFTGSGGLNGSASTVARGDHGHEQLLPRTICFMGTKTADEHGTSDPPRSFLTHMTLLNISTNTYLINAYTDIPGDNPAVLNGSGVVIDNDLFITANFAQEHKEGPSRDAGVHHIRVNRSTLIGTFFQTRLDFDRSALVFEQAYSEGTIAPVACP